MFIFQVTKTENVFIAKLNIFTGWWTLWGYMFYINVREQVILDQHFERTCTIMAARTTYKNVLEVFQLKKNFVKTCFTSTLWRNVSYISVGDQFILQQFFVCVSVINNKHDEIDCMVMISRMGRMMIMMPILAFNGIFYTYFKKLGLSEILSIQSLLFNFKRLL